MRLAAVEEMRNRLAERVAAWCVDVERVTETATAILAFGTRASEPVVLKVMKEGADEWRAGEILDAFDGQAGARVYEYCGGAMLLERLAPAHSLATLSLAGRDDEATATIAATIGAMSPRLPVVPVPSVTDWGVSFERYAARADTRLPADFVREANDLYARLCATQTRVRLLHGDLHHDNILFDRSRGWLAVDPKGVIGEVEYEVGAALRNPCGHPRTFADPQVVRRRVKCFAQTLNLNSERMLGWTYAQAVLATIWAIEDGVSGHVIEGWIALADVVLPMLKAGER